MRREFSLAVRRAVLKRATDESGIPRCEDCGQTGVLEFDHDKPDGLGGEPTEENCKMRCKRCHSEKTHKQDRPRMAKADRQRKKHFLSKHRKFRAWRKFDGTVVRADDQS